MTEDPLTDDAFSDIPAVPKKGDRVDEDQKIIDDVNEWERQDREDRRIREQSQSRFWSRMILLGVFAGGGYWGWTTVLPWMEAEEAREVQEVQERHERQEKAWLDCVNTLGIETCDLIEERLAARCLEGSSTNRGECLEREIAP